jgi:ADP-heptose:LPS heptosyltransferase
MTPQQEPWQTVAVIVGRDLVGDGLFKLPFLRALRAALPAARITWITTEGPTAYAGALAGITAGLIDAVIERAPLGERLGDLLRRPGFDPGFGFDLVLDTRGRWRQALLGRRIPHRRYLCPAAGFLLSEVRPGWGYRRPDHIADRLLDLLRLGLGRAVAVPAGGVALPEAVNACAASALPAGPAYVGLAPGSSTALKVWPLARFLALAARLEEDGLRPVFLLGPAEAAWRAEILAALPAALFPLEHAAWGSGPLTVERTVAVAARLAAAVANDSGTGHMLAAADCPLLSLFGPTSPAKLAPRVSRGRVIRAQDHGGDTMEHIPLAAVVRDLEALLGRPCREISQ